MPQARSRVLEYQRSAAAEGRVVFQADPGELASRGYFVGHTIVADVSPHARFAQEEIFGPILAVLKATDLSDALRIAQDTPYALTGGLYSRSPANIERVKREFRIGNLYINRGITGALVARQPFGGFKLSGIGTKAGGTDYLHEFQLTRCVTENTMRRGFAPDEGRISRRAITSLPLARGDDVATLSHSGKLPPPRLRRKTQNQQPHPEQSRHRDNRPAQPDRRPERTSYQQDHRPQHAPQVEARARARRPQPGRKELRKINRIPGVHAQNKEGHQRQEPERLDIRPRPPRSTPAPSRRPRCDTPRTQTAGLARKPAARMPEAPLTPR